MSVVRALEQTSVHPWPKQKNHKKVKSIYRPTPHQMKELNELTRRREGYEAFKHVEWEDD